MQTHPIADRPWSRLGADLFTLKSKQYIVLVDYYSDYIEVSPGLKDTTSSAIIKFMKQQFSRHGIPDVLVTDNGPQFVSKEFEEFTLAWEFKHVTSWQGWPSGESTCLPPICPGFDFCTRRHTWIEFVGSQLCYEGFSPGHSGFPLSPKTNI